MKPYVEIMSDRQQGNLVVEALEPYLLVQNRRILCQIPCMADPDFVF